MKIHLITGFNKETIEYETRSSTLQDLLYELSKKYPEQKFYNNDWEDVTVNYFVELNGKMHDSLPAELKTKLKDGDSVEIYQSGEWEED